MILCIGPTPAAQRVMVFNRLQIDAVNRAVTTLDGVAGKGINVAKVLNVVGAEPIALGFSGGDRGAAIEAELRSRGIETDFVRVAPVTRQCITVIDQQTGTHTELVEESRAVTSQDYEALLEKVRHHLPRVQAVVLSGTLAPGGSPGFYAECVRLARAAGKLTVADASGAPLMEALKAGPGLVKPNRPELAATVGRKLENDQEILAAMRQVLEGGAERVIVTAGAAPALAMDREHTWRVRAPRIEAVNPIGSGDAFTAALVWRLVSGAALSEACRWASAAGAANALNLMAGELDLKQIEALVPEVRVDPL